MSTRQQQPANVHQEVGVDHPASAIVDTIVADLARQAGRELSTLASETSVPIGDNQLRGIVQIARQEPAQLPRFLEHQRLRGEKAATGLARFWQRLKHLFETELPEHLERAGQIRASAGSRKAKEEARDIVEAYFAPLAVYVCAQYLYEKSGTRGTGR